MEHPERQRLGCYERKNLLLGGLPYLACLLMLRLLFVSLSGKSIFLPKTNPSFAFHLKVWGKLPRKNILHFELFFFLLSRKSNYSLFIHALQKEPFENMCKLVITSHDHDVAHVANWIALWFLQKSALLSVQWADLL